jgi:anti-sigma B factor antagonist
VTAWTVVVLAGELDMARRDEVGRHLAAASRVAPAFLVIDAEHLDFVDSSVLGVLVGVVRDVRDRGGDLRVAACSRAVARLLAITGIDQIIDVWPTVADAVATPAGVSPPAVTP